MVNIITRRVLKYSQGIFEANTHVRSQRSPLQTNLHTYLARKALEDKSYVA